MKAEDLLKDWDVVHAYTEDDAIDDGVLIHPYPDRWPWLLITIGVHAACEDDRGGTDPRSYEERLVPLLMDCIMAVQSDPTRLPPIVLEYTVAGTVWIEPNGKGGMTVMQPHER